MNAPVNTRLMIVAVSALFVRLFLAEQIALLAGAGFQIRLVCAPDAAGTVTPDLLADLPCEVSFLEIPRPILLRKDLTAFFRLLQIIGEWQPLIVHAHGPKASLMAAVAAALRGVPTRLHTIHGLRSEGMRGLRGTIVRTMERLTIACSTQCFAVSRSLARHVVEEGLAPENKVTVLGHGSWAGVSLERFSREPNRQAGIEFRQKHGLPRQAVIISYLGRIAADKGIHTLVEAWSRISPMHPEARLLVAGPLDATDPVASEILTRMRYHHTVHFIEDFVQDVPALLAASDIFVQPSLREGLGVSALEAAAMELPVIVSRVTGLTDTVQDNISGFFFPAQDVGSLADALAYLLVHSETRHRMGLRGRRLVQERFSRPAVLQAALDMYRELPSTTKPAGFWSGFGKRSFDVAVASLILLIASPVMLVIAAAIWFFLSRPVLFTQHRAGLRGKPIRIFKFRTMRSPAPGETMIGTDEQRTHWFGSLLRKLSLDELPQLFNVVRGEMSLIGPRPLLLDYLPRYSEQQRHRHDVLPGITGWAQINGRNAISWEQRFDLDLWYVEHRSAKLDLIILFLTLHRVVWPQGITPAGHTSMPEFLGSSRRLHH